MSDDLSYTVTPPELLDQTHETLIEITQSDVITQFYIQVLNATTLKIRTVDPYTVSTVAGENGEYFIRLDHIQMLNMDDLQEQNNPPEHECHDHNNDRDYHEDNNNSQDF